MVVAQVVPAIIEMSIIIMILIFEFVFCLSDSVMVTSNMMQNINTKEK